MIKRVLKEHPYLASIISTIIIAVTTFILTTWYDLERAKENIESLRNDIEMLREYNNTQDTRMWDLYIRSRSLSQDDIDTE